MYYDENVLLCIFPSDDAITITPVYDQLAYITTHVNGTIRHGNFATIATFDLKNNRTGYWNEVVCMVSEDKKTSICSGKLQGKEANSSVVREIWNYIRNMSGSVIFRYSGKNGEILDYKIGTVKTLGFEDKNGRHHDGDVDVIGMRKSNNN